MEDGGESRQRSPDPTHPERPGADSEKSGWKPRRESAEFRFHAARVDSRAQLFQRRRHSQRCSHATPFCLATEPLTGLVTFKAVERDARGNFLMTVLGEPPDADDHCTEC